MAPLSPPKRRRLDRADVESNPSSSDTARSRIPTKPPRLDRGTRPRKPATVHTLRPRLRPTTTTTTQPVAPSPETLAQHARAQQESQILAEESAIANLEQEIAKLEERTSATTGETDQETMIARLLAANDASLTNLPPAPTFDFNATTADPEIPSALPLAVTDPLPQLRAFSTLTFTRSVITPLQQLSRRHELVGYAGTAPLHCGFRIVLDVSERETVDSLECTVSPWARGDLAGVVADCVAARDPQKLLWALNRYQPLAVRRATTWARLGWRYPSLLLPQFVQSKRGHAGGKKTYKPSSRDVNALLGEGVLVFRRRGAAEEKERGQELVVRWGIVVDDVGEAESVVEADARVPGVWVEVDTDRCLRKVGPLFQGLVKERGVFEAVRCMIELLFPSEEYRE